ncbi:hypothetical protein Peur_021375 [Populus x canadensis]
MTNRAASGLKSYCESWRFNVELNNIKGFEVMPQECVDFIKHYMTLSQYLAYSERAIEKVRLYLSSYYSLESDDKDAWIFYVDDTLLSTVPYFKKHGFGGEKLNATLLEAWMKQGKALTLDHILKLFHEIKDKGVKIFLISSRSETLRSPTVDDLINVGYHGWYSLILSATIQIRGKAKIDKRRVSHLGNHKRSVEQCGGTLYCKKNVQVAKFRVLPFLELPLP